MTDIRTTKDVAAEFGTTVATVRGIIRARGIITKPVPYNGNGKGLDAKDRAIIARALGRTAKRERVTQSA